MARWSWAGRVLPGQPCGHWKLASHNEDESLWSCLLQSSWLPATRDSWGGDTARDTAAPLLLHLRSPGDRDPGAGGAHGQHMATAMTLKGPQRRAQGWGLFLATVHSSEKGSQCLLGSSLAPRPPNIMDRGHLSAWS